MTQLMIDVDRTRDTVILSIDSAVMKVYTAHAKELGQDVGEMLEGLLADWPAILAPAKPKGAVVEAQNNPFGGGY